MRLNETDGTYFPVRGFLPPSNELSNTRNNLTLLLTHPPLHTARAVCPSPNNTADGLVGVLPLWLRSWYSFSLLCEAVC